MSSEGTANLGILLGWKHQSFSGKLVVQFQTLPPGRTEGAGVYDTNDIMMTRNQALVLAEYLTKIASGSPKPSKKGIWKRLFHRD